MAPTSPLLRDRQQQQQQQQQQQAAVGNDDLLPEALPAFPQPVSSLPRNTLQYFPVAAAAPSGLLPVSSSAHSQITTQQQQQMAWNGVYQQPLTAAAVNGMAAPYSSSGLPYDAALAPYAAAYGASYAEPDVPFLLGSRGFVNDMVFANRSVRHGFLRKVLALLALQLLAMAAIAAPLLHDKHSRKFLRTNPWVFALACVSAATLLLVLAWSEGARRRSPVNLLLLGLLTAVAGLLMGIASATYSTHSPLVGLLVSAAVAIALIAYASQTALDFSPSGGMLFSAAVVLATVVAADAWLGFQTRQLLAGGCGGLLFSAWLVVDVHQAATGEGSYTMGADEVVFAALNVFTDVVSSAMYALQVCSAAGSGADDDFM